jgi:hypothetical protein
VVATFDLKPDVVLMPDGRIVALFVRTEEGSQEVAVRTSADDGYSWGEAESLLRLPEEPGGWAGPMGLVDRDGELHLFLLNDAHTGVVRTGEQRQRALPMDQLRLDLWHIKSKDGTTGWQSPKRIWKGYTGALNSVIQLRSGKIIVPFSRFTNRHWADHTGSLYDDYSFTGQYESTAVYSDDSGDTWLLSPSALRVPTPNLYAYGADEPVILQLRDGRVWMLLRTQLGRHYESFSEDGVTWSSPWPSRFIASDSPAGIVRLPDGRIVLIWNNCLRFPYALGGRHVIHAAISADDGASWRGYREVFRDPRRKEPVPKKGDFGTAYPFPAVTGEGKVLLTTGQGEARVAGVLIDPEWLEETAQEDDLSQGLEQWTCFGTRGVELVAHPDRASSRALRIRKTDEGWPAAAVWNFPNGIRGSLQASLLFRGGFAGAHLGLTDHYSVPFDQEDVLYNVFNLPVGPEGTLPGAGVAQTDRWHALELDWNLDKRECQVLMDDRPLAVLPQLRQSTGVCYLRLKCLAEKTDEAGFLVGSVRCDVAS